MQVPFGNARKGTSSVQFVMPTLAGPCALAPRAPRRLEAFVLEFWRGCATRSCRGKNAARQERGAGSHQGAESAGETANAAPRAHSKVADVSAHKRAADVQMQGEAAIRPGDDAVL